MAKGKPNELEPMDLGDPAPGADLDPSLALADALEDAEIMRSQEVSKHRALAAVGRFRSEVGDLSVNHDRHLEDAFEA